MRSALRASMVGLVLLNLAFVYITEAASWIWLGPLLGFTLAAPVLVRYTAHLWYRALWNVSVLAAFGLLIQHIRGAGAAYLLEDGLLLAALCQVHLLNNLGGKQKPDLLLFNSFLIAVVTAYLSLDAAYSALFVAYALLLVVAMHLQAAVRAGVPEEPGLLGRTLRAALGRGAVALGVTMVVFLFWPRDFQRRGVLATAIGLQPAGAGSEVDFSEQVDLDRSGEAVASDRIVMTVRLQRGDAIGVPQHWRGATLDEFDGREWRPAPRIWPTGGVWKRRGSGAWSRKGRPNGTQVEVSLKDLSKRRIFVPLDCVELRLGPYTSGFPIWPVTDSTVRIHAPVSSSRPARYVVRFGAMQRAPGGKTPRSWRRSLHAHLHVLDGALPEEGRRLARALRERAGVDADQHVVVERMRRYLATNWSYLEPGDQGGARNLEAFFSRGEGAHCEFFATALAMMLRSQNIPCRLVTGYRSAEWDDEGQNLTIRARHAHAWVEVYDPSVGWYTVDPTPPAGSSSDDSSAGIFGAAGRWLAGLWEKITGFNERVRKETLAWLAAAPARLGSLVRRHPAPTAGALLLLVGATLLLRRVGRARIPRAVRAYRRCLRRYKLALEPGETPRELLLRAADLVDPESLQQLQAATTTHESHRYQRSQASPGHA